MAAPWILLFDVTASGYKDWWFPAAGLVFVAISAAMIISPHIARKSRLADSRAPWQGPVPYFVGIGGMLWVVAVFWGTYSQYQRPRMLVLTNTCRTVEGPVQAFDPMPFSGHGQETLTVAGVTFRYSNYIVSDAFNDTTVLGERIKPGTYFRVCYDPGDNAILRLEMRDPA